MPSNQGGFAHVLSIIILLLGLAITVYLVQQKQIFKPRAGISTSATIWLTQPFSPNSNLGAPNALVINPGLGIIHYPWGDSGREARSYVGGRALYIEWRGFEPQERNYQWQLIEDALANLPTGRQAWLILPAAVNAPNDSSGITPDWVFAAGVPDIRAVFKSNYHIPVWWNAIFKQKLEQTVAAVAARYDGDPRIAGVKIQGQGQYGEMVPEWERIIYQWDPQPWYDVGFTKARWIQHQKDVMDIYMRHFRKTPLAISIVNHDVGWVSSSDDPIAEPVLNYARDTYGMRLYPKWDGAGLDMRGVPEIFLQYTSYTNVMYEEDGKYFAWGNYPVSDWHQQALNVMGSRASFLYVYSQDFDKNIYNPEIEYLAKYLGPQIFVKTDGTFVPAQASAGQTVNLLIKWGNRGNVPLRKPSNLVARMRGCTTCEKDEPVSAEAFVDLVNTSNNQTAFHYKYVPTPPTTEWYSNIIIDNNISLPLPLNLLEGTYDVRVGIYNPHPSARRSKDSEEFVNFKLLNTDRNDGTDRYTIGRIQISGSISTTPTPAPTLAPIPSVISAANIALNKPVAASSQPYPEYEVSKATDGDLGSRWSSAKTDGEWFYVDLGEEYNLSKVVIKWEGYAYGKDYDIKVSDGGGVWTTVFSRRGFLGGVDKINLSGSGRYVSFQGVKRQDPSYLYSIYEFEVYGTAVSAGSANLALNKTAGASSDLYANIGLGVHKIADGDATTRWSSAKNDSEYVYIDLGRKQNISKVVLKWADAYGKDYDIKVSDDLENWTTVFQRRDFGGGMDTITNLSVAGRYISIQGLRRAYPNWWGYSLYEFEVY